MQTKDLLVALIAFLVGMTLGYLVGTQYMPEALPVDVTITQPNVAQPASVAQPIEEAGAVGTAAMIALSETADGALDLSGAARLVVRNAWIWINSDSGDSIRASNNTATTAQGICTHGGLDSKYVDSFVPQPYTKCDRIADPIDASSYPIPNLECTHTDMDVLKSGTFTLQPGVYCGGLRTSSGADVTMQPGLYVMKDGPFEIASGSSITGNGVTIYLTGAGANINISGSGGVSLNARTEGPWANILFYQDSNTTPLGAKSYMRGSSSAILDGVVYLPNADLEFTGSATFGLGDDSTCSMYIANTFSSAGSTDIYIKGGCAL